MITIEMKPEEVKELVGTLLSLPMASFNEMVLCQRLQAALNDHVRLLDQAMEERYRKFIKDKYEFNDDYSFDEELKIGLSEDGAWVNCWMFISKADLPVEQEAPDGTDS